MRTCKRSKTWPAALAVLLLAPALAPAGDEAGRRAGQVDLVVPAERRIVINDVQYRLPLRTPVHLGRGRLGLLETLQPGTWVEYEVRGEGAGRPGRVAQIWVLSREPARSTE